VLGQTRFADDIVLEKMLHGAILWSAHPHARILSIDVSAALALPGIVAVLTAADIPGENQVGLRIPDQPAFAADKVRFIGDPVAAVYAEDAQAARGALQAIRVAYEPLPGVYSIEEASDPTAPPVHAGGNLMSQTRLVRGDVEVAFLRCASVVEGTYTTPHIDHGFLEPESGLAFPDGDGGVVVQLASQTVFESQGHLARILALPPEKVRVVQLPTGGAFGGKQDLLIHQMLALGALRTGRPVKITLTREESLRAHVKKHPARMRYRLGSDAGGRLLAMEAAIDVDTGAYASYGPDVLENMVCFATGPYFIPAFRIEGRAWYTNNVPSGAMRGFGVNQVAFAMECSLDELGRRLGLDPFALRERNALDLGLPTATDHVIEPGFDGIKQTLAAARTALSGLELPRGDGARRIGVGVASSYKAVGYGLSAPESAEVEVELDGAGKVTVRAGQIEMGQGARSALALLAARDLAAPVDQIEVEAVDSAITPPTGATNASRQTFMMGNALLLACRGLREDAYLRAAEMLHTDVDSLRLCAGALRDEASGREIPVAELGGPIKVRRSYSPPPTLPFEQTSHFGRQDFSSRTTHWAYAYSTDVAIVEVDTVTGEARALTVIAAHDVGRVLNRGSVEAQIAGGVLMGAGYALSEQFKIEQGVNLTDTLHKCGLPTAASAPEVISVLVEVPHPSGPLGAKGLGETPPVAVTPAILNAICDAVGVRIRDLPATRARIRSLLR
jgi:aldehyde oxidoreductase